MPTSPLMKFTPRWGEFHAFERRYCEKSAHRGRIFHRVDVGIDPYEGIPQLNDKLQFALRFDPGIGGYAAQDQGAAQELHGAGDLSEEERRQDGCHHRLAELGGGDKGGGEEFQAPGEDAVPQKGGEYRQQRAHDGGAEAVFQQPLPLDEAGDHQDGGAGGVDHVGVDRGGDVRPDDPPHEGVHRHSHGRQQRQNVPVQPARPGVRPGDEDAARQCHGDGCHSLPGQPSLEKQAEAQRHPDHLGADDGGGACHGGVRQGLKPQHEMDGEKQTAEGAEQRQLRRDLPQLFPDGGFSENHRGHEDNRPKQPPSGGDGRGGSGIFDKDRRQGNADDADDDHEKWMFFDVFHRLSVFLWSSNCSLGYRF